MKSIFYFSGIALLLSTMSCASILTGSTQEITIDSDPQGAKVIIDGRDRGTTPLQIEIDRELSDLQDGGKDIQLEMPGFQSNGYQLDTRLNSVSIINLFNVLFWGIDAATGSITQYEKYNKFILIPEKEENASTPKKTPLPLDSKYESLMKLKLLLDENIITQEEFEAEKARIMSQN